MSTFGESRPDGWTLRGEGAEEPAITSKRKIWKTPRVIGSEVPEAESNLGLGSDVIVLSS